MDIQVPDLKIVTLIAWSEVQEAGGVEGVVGERGRKRKLKGDLANNKSMQLVSQAWRTVL